MIDTVLAEAGRFVYIPGHCHTTVSVFGLFLFPTRILKTLPAHQHTHFFTTTEPTQRQTRRIVDVEMESYIRRTYRQLLTRACLVYRGTPTGMRSGLILIDLLMSHSQQRQPRTRLILTCIFHGLGWVLYHHA